MGDLIERLRNAANSRRATPQGELWNLCDEAADALSASTAREADLLERLAKCTCQT